MDPLKESIENHRRLVRAWRAIAQRKVFHYTQKDGEKTIQVSRKRDTVHMSYAMEGGSRVRRRCSATRKSLPWVTP